MLRPQQKGLRFSDDILYIFLNKHVQCLLIFDAKCQIDNG